MKKILITTFVCLTLFTLAGCKKNNENGDSHSQLSDKEYVSSPEKHDIISQEQAIQMITAMPLDKLNIPEGTTGLKYAIDNKYTKIKDYDCYTVNIFVEENGKRKNLGTYYVVNDGSLIYTFSSSENDYITIEK